MKNGYLTAVLLFDLLMNAYSDNEIITQQHKEDWLTYRMTGLAMKRHERK